jgi:hypothetical protein
MINSIDVSDFEEESYKIDDFEIKFIGLECWALNEDFYIPIKTLKQLIVDITKSFIVDLEDATNIMLVSFETAQEVQKLLISKGIQ